MSRHSYVENCNTTMKCAAIQFEFVNLFSQIQLKKISKQMKMEVLNDGFVSYWKM